MSLRVEEFGSGKKLVILHGWSMFPSIMQNTIDALAKQYCVTLVHLPGIGSPWSEDFKTIHDIAESIYSILPESAIYLGWSLGGQLAMDIARSHPGSVEKLIVVASSPKFNESSGWPGMPLGSFEALGEQFRLKGYHQAVKDFIKDDSEQYLTNDKYQEVLSLIDTWPELDIDILIQGLNLVSNNDLRESMKHVNIPTLFILGENDGCTPVNTRKAIADLSTNIHVEVIQKAAHLPMLSHYDNFMHTLLEFLKEDCMNQENISCSADPYSLLNDFLRV